jgi:hypothetical protein
MALRGERRAQQAFDAGMKKPGIITPASHAIEDQSV